MRENAWREKNPRNAGRINELRSKFVKQLL